MTSQDWLNVLCALEESAYPTPAYVRDVVERLHKGELQTISVTEIEEIRAELRKHAT